MFWKTISIEHTCSTEHSKSKGWRQRKVQTLTFQIDWSENPSIHQAQEKKSAYYHTDQISIHCIHSWSSQGQKLFTAISDHTDHKASAVFASIEPILLKYYQANVHHFNIISESPTSQYQNKNVFWFMCKFYSLKNVSIDWIYLKAGKGKGAADGIGAVVKRAFADIILQYPDNNFESVTDFLQYLPIYIQSIEIFHFIKEDVKKGTYQSFYPSKVQESVTRFRLYNWLEM